MSRRTMEVDSPGSLVAWMGMDDSGRDRLGTVDQDSVFRMRVRFVYIRPVQHGRTVPMKVHAATALPHA